jgi:hypothetical protein
MTLLSQLSHRFLQSRMHRVARNLRQRIEHEIPQVQERVRYYKALGVDYQ